MKIWLCAFCKAPFSPSSSAANRAEKIHARLYCGRKCFSLAHRKENPKTPRNPNWKQMKADYDREYRKKNRVLLKKKKHDYYQRTYDPAKAAKARKLRMPQHVEYYRRPEYRAYKRRYDEQRRAAQFGEFAEAYRAFLLLRKEIHTLVPDRFELYKQSGRQQWSPLTQQRRRDARKRISTDSF